MKQNTMSREELFIMEIKERKKHNDDGVSEASILAVNVRTVM